MAKGKKETDTQPPTIKWKLVEIDKSQIRPNLSNPKIRNEKGFEKMGKLVEKYGMIYDGILNADMSLIDGHSRLEKFPEGAGMYFIPSKQLSEKDEKELNALFDLIKAGDPDMFMIEQLIEDEWLDELGLDGKPAKGKAGKGEDNAKYPLVPQYDEKHEAIVIICSNFIDTTFIKNALDIEQAMSYKNKNVKETSIITAKKFIEKWKSKS